MSGFHTKTFSKHDDYMTPKYAWENIKQFIPEDYKIIYEPFYGDGSSGKFLQELLPDKTIIHQDLDFYEYSTQFNYDMILSNPPFSDAKKIMPKMFELDKPFILLMPSSKINTNYFRQWKERKIQIIIPTKRIHFKKFVNGKEVPTNGANFDCFYYCYKINLSSDITWLES
tara:strand:+ start:166 stop:678 length:513 start_codon:yes stop_codon:yes gene_type:complete